MRERPLCSVSFTAISLLVVCTPATADWRQFQGINRDGRSLEGGMLGNMTCVDRKTHELVWQKQLLEEFGAQM